MILALEIAEETYELFQAFIPTLEKPNQELQEMKGLFSAVKRFWNEIQAVYDPRLVAITDHGIIIDWVDERTGEKPWFS